MIKVNVFDREIEKKPYYIVLSKEEYNCLKTLTRQEIYKYFGIIEQVRNHREDITGILSTSDFKIPDYDFIECTLAPGRRVIYKCVLDKHRLFEIENAKG